MPLTDFVRYLNAQLPVSAFGLRTASPFISEGWRVFVYFGSLRLDSEFSPIVETGSGAIAGHAAQLLATRRNSGHPLDNDGVFALPGDDTEPVHLDRLVRTLHTLNYLIHRGRRDDGLLLLKVHPRHIAGVTADHGMAFEEILRACGLLPRQITLELEIHDVDDTDHLERAIANYQARGYSIGIGRLGATPIDFPLLRRIRPTYAKFDWRRLVSERPIRETIEQLHELGTRAILEGLNTATMRSDARDNGFDLLQVHTPVRRLLHAPAERAVRDVVEHGQAAA